MELLSLVDSGIRVNDPVLEYHDQDFDLSEFLIDQIPTCDHSSNSCSYATSMDTSGRGSKSVSNSIDENWHLLRDVVDGDFTSPPTGFYGDSGKGLIRANDPSMANSERLLCGISSFGQINSSNSLSHTSHKATNYNLHQITSSIKRISGEARPRSTYINRNNIVIPTKRAKSKEIPIRRSTTYETPNAKAIMQVKEMIYRAAVLRPVNLGPETPVEKPKRKNMKISKEPQTVAARQRRERVGERIRVLGRLVPGGTKMDTATMLEEAVNYLNFLKSQLANSSAPPSLHQNRSF